MIAKKTTSEQSEKYKTLNSKENSDSYIEEDLTTCKKAQLSCYKFLAEMCHKNMLPESTITEILTDTIQALYD